MSVTDGGVQGPQRGEFFRGKFIDKILLPGLAFKACVIGGGYATGRELTEYFLSNGPINGLLAMLVATAAWSLICALTFMLAVSIRAYDYNHFFRALLGRVSPCFEVLYFAFLMLILSVFGAAAGEIGLSLFGAPKLAGTLMLIVAILAVTYSGQAGVERLFKYVSILLYLVYEAFLVISLWHYGDRVWLLPKQVGPSPNWFGNGVDYASYNVVAAVMILPVLRHQTRVREAAIAGLLCGPLAMAPALIFFMCLLAVYPVVLDQTLPSDYVLKALNLPALRYAFQIMIFFALLESSVGYVQALQMRAQDFFRRFHNVPPRVLRLTVPLGLTVGSIFIASKVGLVALIAQGYRLFGYAILLVYIMPLVIVGLPLLLRRSRQPPDHGDSLSYLPAQK